MKKRIEILVLSIMTISVFGCSVSTDNLPEPKELKTAIAESIQIPFEKSDTVIYNSFIGICGNSSEGELRRYYEPQLNELPYSTILTQNYKGKIWFTGEQLYQLMDSVCAERRHSETVWDCFSKDKIDFILTGRAISNNSIEIYERYFLNNEVYSITKIFEYEDGKWAYQITENE